MRNLFRCFLYTALVLFFSCSRDNMKSDDDGNDPDNPANSSAKWVKVEYYRRTKGTIGLKSDGTLWSWGSNANGEAGLGTLQESLQPVKVLDNIADFAGAFALKKDGTLWGTGLREKFTVSTIPGSCGGTSQTVHCYFFPSNRLQFEQVGSDANWTKISYIDNLYLQKNDGYTYGAGIMTFVPEDYLWGKDECGDYRWQVPVGFWVKNYVRFSQYKWKEWFLDWNTIGIKEDGTLWYYFKNINFISQQTPDPRIPKQYGTDTNWKTIEKGSDYPILMKTDGSVWQWSNYSATRLGTDNWKMYWSFNSGYNNKQKNFGIKTDGTLWGWGDNSDGFLGTGNYTSSDVPVKLSQENNWEYIYSDGDSERPATTFAINSKGEIWGWGNNTYGQLGDGTKTDKYVPTLLQK